MKNTYFEISLFNYLFSFYKLDEAEALLCNQKIKPLLDMNVYVSKISKYIRFMNKPNYSKLSFWDRKYISKHFTNEFDIEKNWNKKKSINIYNKLIKEILMRPNGSTVYCYDGTALRNHQPHIDLSTQFAPNNYITFGIYYTQFDENTKDDDFRNYNIVVDIANHLQANNIAIVLFSEVDVYKMDSVRL